MIPGVSHKVPRNA